jgi:signal transduction histidine kinase
VKLTVKTLPGVVLLCRPTQISQVILNLLNNAFDAVKALNEKWVLLEVACLGTDWIQIRVTDSGAGIAESLATKIMEPFFTTKEIGKGTGLGLSISKGIVETHGGRFFLDRSFTHTSFVIEFPVSKAS